MDEASFVAPPAERVSDLMEDLVDYLNTSSHPAVLRAAIVHAQFETIHPFVDGNGRTGRALIHTVLNAEGLARGAVPISTALSRDRHGYYDALNATRVVCARDDLVTRSAALRRWLATFGYACEEAHRQAASVVRTVEGIAARWRQAAVLRSDSTAAALLEVLPSIPVLDAELVTERLGVTARAARRAVSSLEQAGILCTTGGSRNRRYTALEMVGMLRRMAPDGGVAPWGDTAVLGAPHDAPSVWTACDYRGPRSNRQCRLPKGHAGQHRYLPPNQLGP